MIYIGFVLLGLLHAKLACFGIAHALEEKKLTAKHKVLVTMLCILYSLYFGVMMESTFEYFLITTFYCAFVILMFSDAIEMIVDDRFVIIGWLLVTILQFISGTLLFSLLGSLAGLLVSGVFFLLGKQVATPVPSDVKQSLYTVALPFIPSLFIAVTIHFVIPNGLLPVFYTLMSIFRENIFLQFTLGITWLCLVLWRLEHNRHQARTEEDEKSESMPGFGDGDITGSIFLGAMLGWQGLLLVFGTALVIHILLFCMYSIHFYGKKSTF